MPEEKEFDALMVHQLNDFPGTAGIIIQDLNSGYQYQHNAQEIFPAASLIKLPILLAYYLQVQDGRLVPQQRIQPDPGDIVGGYGIIRFLTPGCWLTLQDLATLMIIVSDNTATNMMIDILGIDPINQTCKTFDLNGTILTRKMFDWEGIAAGLDNFTTPADMAQILGEFLSSESLSASSKSGILSILEMQRFNDKLPALTGQELTWAHKTGEVPGVEHDVGIVSQGDQRIIVAALTKDLPAKHDGVWLLNEIGRHAAQLL